MNFELKKLSPVFLEKEKVAASEVWNADLNFRKGERIQLRAPSGSGKTSFIHFLYGLRADYKGQVLFGSKNIAGLSPEQMATYRNDAVSIVFQDLRLFNNHSVMENINIKKSLNAYPNASGIIEMADRLGIKSKLEQKAGICSYGEQQRIAIIRALQQPFDFLILDEPFSHLDEDNAKKAMELIDDEVEKRNAGIILTDLAELLYFKAERTYKL